MAIEEVKKVVMMMIEDEEFEREVFEDPDTALSGFDLTDDEIGKLKLLDKEKLKQIAMDLDNRLSKDESWWVDSVVD